MFRKFFERAAGKSSLFNIKCDLERLESWFPHNVPGSSKTLFTLVQNITYAFSNNAPTDDIHQLITTASADFPPELRQIVDHAFWCVAASQRGDTPMVAFHDGCISELFQTATGRPLR